MQEKTKSVETYLPDNLIEFIEENIFVRGNYELFQENLRAEARYSLESLCTYIVWLVSSGRNELNTQMIINRKIQETLSWSDASGCSMLMLFLAAKTGNSFKGDYLRAWYYFCAVPHFNIGYLIGRHDMNMLKRPSHQPQLQSDFDHLRAIAYEAGWLTDKSHGVESVLAEMCSAPRAVTGHDLPTVSIVGFHRSVLGLGEDARCLHDCLCAIGICAELIDVSPPGLESFQDNDRYKSFTVTRPTGSVIIFCLPIFETMRAMAQLNLHTRLPGQHRVGYWPWETTAHPKQWHFVYDMMDELWASSTFLKHVFEAETAAFVAHIPLHVRVEAPILRADLEDIFQNAFCFLCVFDFNSRIERKNPEGAITAFRRAFPEGGESVRLILKTLHGANRPKELQSLVSMINNDSRIIIVDGAVSKGELCGMIKAADIYLSTHRSEGFGRPIVEAMLLGTAVIATQWSGCADFVREDTAFPIHSILRDVGSSEYPFAAGSWAEPDVECTIALMQKAYRMPDLRKVKAVEAKHLAKQCFERDAVAPIVRERLSAIGRALKG